MKLDIKDDFTSLPRAGAYLPAADVAGSRAAEPFDEIVLAHDERHLRRRVLVLSGGSRVHVDLPQPVALDQDDLLLLDDGRTARIVAAPEEVYEIRGRDGLHLAQLCWHIGNRHLAAQIEEDRILILRDHVMRDMLAGLGASVSDVVEAFRPLRGAYAAHAHGHHHDHGGGERDSHGRLPGDPHYGHNHA